MALIIKGEMPKGCTECPMQYVGEERTACFIMNCYNKTFINKRPSWCPILGEIADEHGMLIDADFFEKYAIRVNINGKEYVPADYIKIVPTVLEDST